jgi:hypothetical protein
MLSGLHNALNAHTLERIFYIITHTLRLSLDGWLIWCMYQMVGCIHHSPFLAAGNAVPAWDMRTQLECDGRKRVAADVHGILENSF